MHAATSDKNHPETNTRIKDSRQVENAPSLNKTINHSNSSLNTAIPKVNNRKGSTDLKCYNNPIHGIRKQRCNVGNEEAARRMEDAVDIGSMNPIRNPIGRSDNPYINNMRLNAFRMSPFKEAAKDLIGS